jgi:glyoxylase-like metal-dependent hydrolase (beta-lactamase superfamily II)
MLFRQLFDAETSTYTYLLADEATHEAVIIDPVFEQLERDVNLICELDLRLMAVLETHVHADHVSAQGLLRTRLGAKTVMSERSGAVCADVLVKQGDRVTFGHHELEVRETPGHTSGCLTFICYEPRMAFMGDALKRSEERLREQDLDQHGDREHQRVTALGKLISRLFARVSQHGGLGLKPSQHAGELRGRNAQQAMAGEEHQNGRQQRGQRSAH